MRSILAAAFVFADLAVALPQEGCVTSTKQVIVPTKTATYSRTVVVTEHPTTARDLGTFTLWSTITTTTTLQTVTDTTTVCGETGTVTEPASTTTVYASAAAKGKRNVKRELGLNPRDDAACTVTQTSYTTYGQTYTYVPAGKTSTYYQYTDFTQATVTSTKEGGKDYAIATAFATASTTCGSVTVTESSTTTVTMDPKCSPAAQTSAYNGFGIDWISDTPSTGATWLTNTTDASSCCQLCATSYECAASAWDIRTGACRLEFATDPLTGEMNCGQGLLGYYDAGPSSPMDPGTGWYVAKLCGTALFGASQPDDGS